jgi:L-cysteine/cystine lyase
VNPSDPDEADRLAAVRAVLPALDAGIYLNTGTSGPLPSETAAVMAQMAESELSIGRAQAEGFAESLQRMDEARAAVAALLTADVDDVGLTHGATDGMNVGLHGIDWAPGDKAVATNAEHPGGIGALHAIRARRGIDIEFLDIGDGADDDRVVAAFEAAVDPRTKAVVISHVLWTNGAVMPLRPIADLAHAHGAIVVVDGAQSAGAIRIDLEATGADVYAIPGQKWLLGPEGTGAVAVSRHARDRVAPTYAGSRSFEQIDPAGDARFWSTGRRYEGTGFHRPSVVGMARSIGWLSMYVGLDWIYERGHRLACAMADRLAAIPGVDVITPRHHMATLVSFRVAGWTPDQLREELGARVFAITRTIPAIDVLRISVGFFNSEDELERFAAAVELLAAYTPATIPRRRTLTILGEE